MDFDVGDLFGNLFGGAPTTMHVQPEVVPEPIPGPEAVDLPTLAVDTEWAELERLPDFDSLPLPGDPCPVCGSLETWWDMLGGEHCQQCERATLDKAMQWADRATRLREQAQPRKPAPRIAPRCVAAGEVDTLDPSGNRPLQSQPRGLCGVAG